jgi:4-hydroxybenzoyl-CoA thioesterase
MSFTFKQKVLFKHCDPAGIVFYPRYFEMINDAVEAFFDEVLDLPFERMHPETGVPTAAIDIRFRAPSRHGDRLAIALTPVKLGRTSLDLTVVATCGDETRFEARHTLVHVDGMRPAPWPEAARAVLADAVRKHKESSDAAA